MATGHCFNKKQDMHHIVIVFNLKARKVCFCFVVQETETCCGVVIFWQVGETIVKNENCIVLPESRYVNSKPGLVWNLIKLRKSYEYDKSKIED